MAISPVAAVAGTSYSLNTAGIYSTSADNGASHQSSTGGFSTSISYINAGGAAAGLSTRYNSGTGTLGNNAYYYNPATQLTTEIGYDDPAHTQSYNASDTGTQLSALYTLTASGEAVGRSGLYSGSLGTFGSIGNELWAYTPSAGTVEIGLFGTINGIQYFNDVAGGTVITTISAVDVSGNVVGQTSRYSSDGNATGLGQDSFYYNATTNQTIPIGLAYNSANSSNYCSSGGHVYVNSSILTFNANGLVAGTSQNYTRASADSATNTLDAYVFTPSTGVSNLASLSGSQYSSATISKFNNTVLAGTEGLVVNISSSVGFAYNVSTGAVSQIGLVNQSGGYVGPNSSTLATTITNINNLGQVIGQSTLFTNVSGADTASGSDAFIFDGRNTIPIGLTDALHTANPTAAILTQTAHGSFTSYVVRTNTASILNNAGQVVGTSAIFNTSSSTGTAVATQYGQNAWYYSPATGTVTIGLVDAVHTSSNGLNQSSSVLALNDNGQAFGTSTRYSGTATAGTNVWYYSAASTSGTTTIGLIDGPAAAGVVSHTSSDGITQNSSYVTSNSTGQAIGTSNRYVGATTEGSDAWVFTPGVGTTLLGPNDSLHTALNLSVSTTPSFLTNSGLVAGTATRYLPSSNTTNGSDVFFYDTRNNASFTLTPFANPSTGYASATVKFLGEYGLVVGTFVKTGVSGGPTDFFVYQEGQSIVDLGPAAGFPSSPNYFNTSSSASIFATATITQAGGGSGTAAYVFGAGPANLNWGNYGTAGADETTWNTVSPNFNNGIVIATFNGSSGPGGTSGDNVLFSDYNSNHYSVVINSSVTPGSIVVNTSYPHAYTFTGSGIIGGNGGLTLNGTGTLTIANVGPNSYGSTTVNAGTLILGTAGALPVGKNLTIAAGANVVSLNHAAGATSTVLQVAAFTNAGTLDLGDNSLIITAAGLAAVNAQVAAGYNNGQWTGVSSTGGVITSSAAAATADHLTALGVVSGQTSFEGLNVSASSVLVKYTFYGDSNLDGKVDGSDYSQIDYAYSNNLIATNPALTGWSNGDFNYDGFVDGSDYALIDNTFNNQNASDSALISEQVAPTALVAAQPASVPEPSAAALIPLAVTLVRRYRRRQL